MALVLLAASVAVLFPVMLQQLGVVDPVRIAHDLSSTRTAIESFHVNTRDAYPSATSHLLEPITTGDFGIDGTNFTPAQVAGWRGPYLDAAESPGSSILTGAAVEIKNGLVLFDTDANQPALSVADGDWVAVVTTEMSAEIFEQVNDYIDGRQEPDGYGEGLSSHTGRLRLVPPFPPFDLTNVSGDVYYLSVPFVP